MTTRLTPDLLEKADSFLDGEKQYETACTLGRRLYATFGSDDEGRTNTQVRNLQQITVSATRMADIEDFVKNQMGKRTGAYKEWRQVGDETLSQLARLRSKADELGQDQPQRLLLRLHLARSWVRAVVGAYLYAKAQADMEKTHA